MSYNPDLARYGVYETRAPRYTSYPTAAQFNDGVGAQFFEDALASLPRQKPISLYLHIPFCRRLCWFCACRTQGTQTDGPLEGYLNTLMTEMDRVGQAIARGVEVGEIHWGGGTPTILTPTMIKALGAHTAAQFDLAKDVKFSVEIDPTLVDQDKIRALAEIGMTRASIGVQDFAPETQKAIGRMQSFAQTQTCVEQLRAAGISSLNIDMLYGLPFQTETTVRETVASVIALSPDRIALFGYAHVPWMAKRQKLIDESALPDDITRTELFELMSELLVDAGYQAVGIDHFAKAGDEMVKAREAGTLRRNFQGYTTDECQTLVGLGASSISRFTGGFVQNAPKTGEYARMIGEGGFSAERGVLVSAEDRVRGRMIEQVMCDFVIDASEFSSEALEVFADWQRDFALIAQKFPTHVTHKGSRLILEKDHRIMARMVAFELDQYSRTSGQFSKVS